MPGVYVSGWKSEAFSSKHKPSQVSSPHFCDINLSEVQIVRYIYPQSEQMKKEMCHSGRRQDRNSQPACDVPGIKSSYTNRQHDINDHPFLCGFCQNFL